MPRLVWLGSAIAAATCSIQGAAVELSRSAALDKATDARRGGRGGPFSRMLDSALSRKAHREGAVEYGSKINPPLYLDIMISPVFVDKRPGSGSFIGCFPCKNGMSWWTKFACAVDQTCEHSGTVPRLFHLHVGQARQVLDDLAIPRFVVTRNPLVRALSAFLTWVDHGNEFNYVPPSFVAFAEKLDLSRVAFPTSETYTWSKNPHWRPQVEYCGLNYGEKYVYYRAEDRAQWSSHLFGSLGRGYGDVASSLNFTRAADQPNTDDSDCPGYFCHARAIMAEYFTIEIFDRLRRFYSQDIKEFGYEDDVLALSKELFGDGGGQRGRPQHALMLRRGGSSGGLPGKLRGLQPAELAGVLDAWDGTTDV